jgi:hypothetical protein
VWRVLLRALLAAGLVLAAVALASGATSPNEAEVDRLVPNPVGSGSIPTAPSTAVSGGRAIFFIGRASFRGRTAGQGDLLHRRHPG